MTPVLPQNRSYKVVLANGAFKSGSTWLKEIARQLVAFERLPDEYVGDSISRWLVAEKVSALVSDDSFEGPYLSKSHIYSTDQINLVANKPGVKIMLIHRDLRDVTVSAFYHFRRVKKIPMSFGLYYWTVGRLKAIEVMEYHSNWEEKAFENVFFTSFEALKLNFDDEVRKLARFLELDPDLIDLETIKRETSIDFVRKKRKQDHLPEDKRFFRKGVIGDWKRHFNGRMLKDLSNVEQGDVGGFTQALYYLLFTLRRRIQKS